MGCDSRPQTALVVFADVAGRSRRAIYDMLEDFFRALNIIQWSGGSDSELGVFIFPTHSLFNGEPRSYSEFPNHLTVNDPFKSFIVDSFLYFLYPAIFVNNTYPYSLHPVV